VNLNGINWLIVGSENCDGARPFQLDWAQDFIRECCHKRVACFVKRVGRRPGRHSSWIVPRLATQLNGRRIGFVDSRHAPHTIRLRLM
jgi:protein gp37